MSLFLPPLMWHFTTVSTVSTRNNLAWTCANTNKCLVIVNIWDLRRYCIYCTSKHNHCYCFLSFTSIIFWLYDRLWSKDFVGQWIRVIRYIKVVCKTISELWVAAPQFRHSVTSVSNPAHSFSHSPPLSPFFLFYLSALQPNPSQGVIYGDAVTHGTSEPIIIHL